MNVTGIIAEYNPFHNGHQYHIEQTRRLADADYCIAVISGDFVQRGAPALLDKYARAEMALNNGIDLVIALPVVCSTANAGIFAQSGVGILSKLGVVTDISFGCEAAGKKEQDLLTEIAAVLAREPDLFRKILSVELAKGRSYPAARAKALTACFSQDPELAGLAGLLLSGSNNILAIEYLQAIAKTAPSLSVCMIPRKGASYHEETLSPDQSFPSATSLRPAFLAAQKTGSLTSEKLQSNIPANALPLLSGYQEKAHFLSEEDFSGLLYYSLRKESDKLKERFSQNPELANTICHLLESFTGWQEFALSCKSKNITYTAVSRFLTQILLGIGQQELLAAESLQYAPYARILGFRKEATPLLAAIQKMASVPVIARPAEALRSLPAAEKSLFELDLMAGDLYAHTAAKGSGAVLCELRRPLIYL